VREKERDAKLEDRGQTISSNEETQVRRERKFQGKQRGESDTKGSWDSPLSLSEKKKKMNENWTPIGKTPTMRKKEKGEPSKVYQGVDREKAGKRASFEN